MNDHRINLRRNIFKEEAIMCCSKFWVSLAFTVMSFKRFSTFVNPSPPTVPFPVYILCDQNSENSTKFQKKRTTSRASSQIFEKNVPGVFVPFDFQPWIFSWVVRISENIIFWFFGNFPRKFPYHFSPVSKAPGILAEWKVPSIEIFDMKQLVSQQFHSQDWKC